MRFDTTRFRLNDSALDSAFVVLYAHLYTFMPTFSLSAKPGQLACSVLGSHLFLVTVGFEST